MTNWLDKMIERQATPEALRAETTTTFCKEHKLTESNYYYHTQKEENQKKIIACCLRNAKKHAPDVLENLGVRGKKDNRAAELYMKFILELAEKTDIVSDGKPLGVIVLPAKNEDTLEAPTETSKGTSKHSA